MAASAGPESEDGLSRVGDARIRAAEPGDLAALSDLAKRTWSDAFGGGLNPEDETAELEDGRSEAYFAAALQESESAILVAERHGALLGYVQFGEVTVAGVRAEPEDRAVQRLYVETTLHGRGLGRRLLETALADPRLAGAKRVFLQVWEENEAAVGLYESVGFRGVGTTTFTIGDSTVEDLVMVREGG